MGLRNVHASVCMCTQTPVCPYRMCGELADACIADRHSVSPSLLAHGAQSLPTKCVCVSMQVSLPLSISLSQVMPLSKKSPNRGRGHRQCRCGLACHTNERLLSILACFQGGSRSQRVGGRAPFIQLSKLECEKERRAGPSSFFFRV